MDTTLASTYLSSSFSEDHVLSEIWLSDAKHIWFGIAADIVSGQTYRNFKFTKWKLFRFLLSENIKTCPHLPNRAEDIELEV